MVSMFWKFESLPILFYISTHIMHTMLPKLSPLSLPGPISGGQSPGQQHRDVSVINCMEKQYTSGVIYTLVTRDVHRHVPKRALWSITTQWTSNSIRVPFPSSYCVIIRVGVTTSVALFSHECITGTCEVTWVYTVECPGLRLFPMEFPPPPRVPVSRYSSERWLGVTSYTRDQR